MDGNSCTLHIPPHMKYAKKGAKVKGWKDKRLKLGGGKNEHHTEPIFLPAVKNGN